MNDDRLLRLLAFSLALAGTALLVFALIYGRTTKAVRTHTLAREARSSYNTAEYNDALSSLQFLVDTLGFRKEGAQLNLAHAGFLAARYDSAGRARDSQPVDTVSLNRMKELITLNGVIVNYDKLIAPGVDPYYSSRAYNQLGVVAYNTRNRQDETAAMTEAAEHFRNALRKDPKNDEARYNYELIRYRIDYPEMIMARVRELIRRRNYKAARNLLKDAFDRDAQIRRGYEDYVIRLENIIRIDSLSRS
jgi:tetratricopeptide (TPR) repeat protein